MIHEEHEGHEEDRKDLQFAADFFIELPGLIHHSTFNINHYTKYAALAERSMLILAEIGAMVDVEAGRMLDRLDAVEAVRIAMVEERAYWRGMREGLMSRF